MGLTRELYLVRHAIAAERGEKWPDDRVRPLTPEGIERFALGVRGLAVLGVQLDGVLTSPFVRATQTAELLARGLGVKSTPRVFEQLLPGSDPEDLVRRLAGVSSGRRIASVGHEPSLGVLAGYLIGGAAALPFKKGGVCRIDVATSGRHWRGELIWFVTPKILRALGGTSRRIR